MLRSLSRPGQQGSSADLSDGRYLMIGFACVIFLLLLVGAVGWAVLSGQNRSFDRFSAAGDLLGLMDDARLAELTFTRDETESSAALTEEITADLLVRAEELKTLVADPVRKARIDEAITAIQRFDRLFRDYVEFNRANHAARNSMVAAAVRASESSIGLQHIQDKYIRLDTQSVSQFRRQAELISENTANSYEIVIFVEEALDNEKNFLLTQDRRDLERVRSIIVRLTTVLTQLKGRIADPHSLELLDKIDHHKDVYLKALDDFERAIEPGQQLRLESPAVLALDRAAFGMRDAAFALRSNERAVLASIQGKVADMQDLMARRLALSEDVSKILFDVSEARQIDRDFLLARTDEERHIYGARVMTLLADVLQRAGKIQELLIQDDEKEAFVTVVPSIELFRDKFAETVEAALKASQTGQAMVDAALEADALLNKAQSSRMQDIAEAREWARVLGPMAIIFAIGIILLAVLMRKAQRKLGQAYDVISSSIDYASNIQRSILPEHERFSAVFEEYFVIWEPRDRVGGDIYWNHHWGEGSLVVLADCTGHGVPGAFMSLIAHSALENALDEVEPGDVGGVIKRMHQRVQATLSQHLAVGVSDDGLELGAIFIVPEKRELVFAGARFSLFVVRETPDSEVSEVKGDKKGIGYRGIPFDQSFVNHPVSYEAGSRLYMSSDGFIDQVGGRRRRSFGKRRFRDLLKSLHSLPMSEQKTGLERALAKYQGSEIRRDDISVIGLKIR